MNSTQAALLDRPKASPSARPASGGNPMVVFTGPGKVELQDHPIPAAFPGQVLIRTSKTLISTGTELTVLSGDFPQGSRWEEYARFPFLAGYDNVGTIVETGEGVDATLTGRKVATYGKHARFTTCAAADLRLLPEGIREEQAVFFTIAEIAMNGVRRGGVEWGEAVAVYGQGLLGQLAARICRLAGAKPVLAIDPAESRLARLPNDPAILRVNPKREEVEARIQSATGGRLVDVVFEVTGAADLIAGEFRGLRPQGRFVVLSSPRGKSLLDLHDLCNAPSFTIIGAHNGSHPAQATPQTPWTKARHNELFFDLLVDGSLDLSPLISDRASYREAPALYAQLLADRSASMGVVLDWEGD
ncbi:MAG: zinc-binding dehydrogenase [Spirochaetes bacterium]|nr:zinc-binding dehydrogenase [Spirochaetota bacterium]